GGFGSQGGFGGHQGGFDSETKFEDGQEDENNR
ncbi:RNA chaperone Hfq, partial [Acinetobacter junii]|nr:RNA chaperone Hfq [Acinetobacter junii]